jgi:hypothetical protein
MSIEGSHGNFLLISISLALFSVTWLKNLFQKQGEPEEPSDSFHSNPTEMKDTQMMPEPKTEPVLPGITMGTLLNDRYLLQSELGSGGFGIVYLAEDQRAMNKRVVIKCMLDSKEQSKDFAWYEKKFNQEQEALVRIKHPNVVEVTEIGQAPNGKPYFVMEYVEGESLQRLMVNNRLNLKRISNIMEQTCKAVSAAHDRGVLHCDLKPANIMVQSLSDGEDHVKVIDFGIAKLTGSQFARTDNPTKLAGSLPYMAPEQHMGQVSQASDVYALGIIAYQMATGLPPINSGSLVFEDYDVRLKIAESNLIQKCSELPESAREIILKAIARNSDKRYQQAREFGSELARAIRGESTTKIAAQMRVALLYKRNTEPDNEILQMLESRLTAKNFKVFVDRHLAVGMEWAKEIEKQIRASDAVIPLISEASAASEMMAYEIETAHLGAQEHHGKPRILPIRINYEATLADPMGSILEPLQYMLWKSRDDNEGIVGELIEALKTPFEYKPAKLPKIGETVVGAVPLDSEFYIVRPTDEEFLSALAHRDSIVLIKGGRQMGKTSLLARGLRQARTAGSRVVLTDFQKLNSTHMQSAEVLFKTLGAMIADQLDLDALPEDVWDDRRGASLNFERFIKREVLRKISQPLVWAMDEIDRLFSCDFGSEVFGLFRSWHNDRQLDPEGPWQQLTLAIVYATEAHLFITDLNQSPFNVGTRLTLSDFTFEQVAELNRRYGSPLKSRDEAERLYRLLSGQPFLVRRGLQGLAAHKIKFDEMEKTADRNEGPFGDHLRRLLVLIAQDGDLINAMRGLIHESVPPPDNIFYRLRSAGILIGDSGQEAQPRCLLYANYFARHLQRDL